MKYSLAEPLMEELKKLTSIMIKGTAEERIDADQKLRILEAKQKVPLESIIALSEDADFNLSAYGIEALGRNGSPKAAEQLLRLMRKKSAESAIFVENIINAMAKTNQSYLAGHILELAGLRASKTNWLKKKISPPKILTARNRELLILSIARAVADLATPEYEQEIISFLDHKDPLVRWHALRGIQKANLTNALDKIKDLRSHENNDLIKEALEITINMLERQNN